MMRIKAIQLVALGNPIMSDDGAGPFLLNQLKKANWPCRVTFSNAGITSFDYIQLLKKDERIFILDTLRTGRPPGTVVKLRATQLELTLNCFSLHDLHLLHLARSFYPHRLKQIFIYGIEPLSLQPGTSLSRPVRQCLPLLRRIIILDIFRNCNATLKTPAALR
ncbi:MAG: hydrogenase maturation protease [Dethiobacter sp.]|jgi:hydrogenase maturation protease|nr:hydrogenase maturation protease [Dethiobacter sp.]